MDMRVYREAMWSRVRTELTEARAQRGKDAGIRSDHMHVALGLLRAWKTTESIYRIGVDGRVEDTASQLAGRFYYLAACLKEYEAELG